jgi:type VI secretion system secreted protein Hcp
MAVDMFIKFDGIKGESQDSKHKDTIDVLSWNWGASQSGTSHLGGGGGAGKVAVQDLVITKYVDKSTPPLMTKLYTGDHIPKALLTVRKAGGEQQEFIKIEMTHIIVTNLTQGASASDDRFTETISINFDTVKLSYCSQKKDGTLDAAVDFGYDIAANKKIG